jgi:hypothetical protein
VAKSSLIVDRREFLTLALALPLASAVGVHAETQPRKSSYAVEAGILYDAFTFRLEGTIEEMIDRAAGRYEVHAIGEGDGLANRIDSSGRLRDGLWWPEHGMSYFRVRGRESRSDIAYDWTSRKINYKFRGETFFLRRVRVVEDTITAPEGVHVDDTISAVVNYADGAWKPDADGAFRTRIVRRHKRENEGPDDVDKNAHAEIVSFEMRPGRDEATGKQAASFDMTRFSSWAKRDKPARIVFGADRRPELITSSLMLGTSITIRLREI